MSSQSTLDKMMITDTKVMTWIRTAANDVSNLAATSELLAIGFTAAFNNTPPPAWAWSEFCVLADRRLEAIGLPRRYFEIPTATQASIWNATENKSRNRTRFPKSGPLGDMIIPASDSPQPATASPTPLSSAEPETPVNTAPRIRLPAVHTPAIPKAAEVKEAELTASELKSWGDNEPHRLGSDGFIITQPAEFTPAPIAPTTRSDPPVPVGAPEQNEEMIDSISRPPTGYNSPPRPSTPQPAQRDQDEEARFMKMMEEMTERVTFRVTARLTNEVARLARELSTANTTIMKMAAQLTILQGPTTTTTKRVFGNNSTTTT